MVQEGSSPVQHRAFAESQKPKKTLLLLHSMLHSKQCRLKSLKDHPKDVNVPNL